MDVDSQQYFSTLDETALLQTKDDRTAQKTQSAHFGHDFPMKHLMAKGLTRPGQQLVLAVGMCRLANLPFLRHQPMHHHRCKIS